MYIDSAGRLSGFHDLTQLDKAVENTAGHLLYDTAKRIEKIAADGNNILASEMLVKIAKEERSKELANEMGTPDDPAAVAGS
jgi:glycyl-tRNA synthetase beta subunit